MSKAGLRLELQANMANIDKQIKSIQDDYPDADWHKIQDQHGNRVFVPLLLAKTNILLALATLEDKQR